MTKEDLKKIRENLPTRYLNELVKRTGKSRSSCSDVMKGRFHSDLIIREAIKFAKETQAQKKAMLKDINSL